MAGARQGHHMRELLSPGPSLETEDDEDEDFVLEEEAAENEDEDDSSSDEGEEEDEEEEEQADEETDAGVQQSTGGASQHPSAAAAGGCFSAAPSDVQRSVAGGDDELRRRLQELGVALGGDEDVVFEEEILSDSDISDHFPEEQDQDDEAAALLLGDSSEEEYSTEEEEGAEPEQGGAEGAAAEQQRGAPHVQQQVQAADAAAMPPPPPRLRAAFTAVPADAGSAGPGSSRQQQQQQLALGIGPGPPTAQLASMDVAAGAGGGSYPADDPFGFAAAEAEMNAFGAQLGTLEDPIAHRTRAHHSLAEVDIEDLEQLLQIDDELEGLGLDDAEEYQRFLQSLRVGECGASFAGFGEEGDDSDDGDFFQELRDMLGLEQQEAAGPGRWAAGSGGSRRRKSSERVPRQRKPRAPKAPRWTRGRAGERTIESVAALREHRLRPLAPKPFITDLARLSTLAAAAAGQVDPRPPVAVDTIVGPMLVPAAAVAGPPLPPLPPGINRERVAWQPPLPAALRKYLPPEAAGMVAGGRQEPLPVGAPPPEGTEVQAAAFQPKQYRQLYHLIHQHAQLLMQVYLMAACSKDPAHLQVAQQAQRMAQDLHLFAQKQSAARQAQGIAPYNPDALGFSDRLPPLPEGQPDEGGDVQRRRGRQSRLQRELEDRRRLDASQAAWRPWSNSGVFSVADVAPLRWMNHVTAGVPLQAQLQLQDQPQSLQQRACGGAASSPQQEQHPPNSQQQQQPGSGLTAGPHTGLGQLPAGGRADGASNEDDDEDVRAAMRAKRSKKKLHVPLMHNPLWSKLPPAAATVVADVQPLLEPMLLPKAPDHIAGEQLLFTPAEDELLALGLRRFAYDWPRIRSELLPTKTVTQLKNRRKNRCAGNAPDNCIKDAVRAITGELQADEIALLEKALHYYGRQPKRWEIICRDHLPHRQPNVLATLWSQHTDRASVRNPTRPSGGMRRMQKKRRQAGEEAGDEDETQSGASGWQAAGDGDAAAEVASDGQRVADSLAGSLDAPTAGQQQPLPPPPPQQQQPQRPRRRGRQEMAAAAAAAAVSAAPRQQRPAVRSMFLSEGPAAAVAVLPQQLQQQDSQQPGQPAVLLYQQHQQLQLPAAGQAAHMLQHWGPPAQQGQSTGYPFANQTGLGDAHQLPIPVTALPPLQPEPQQQQQQQQLPVIDSSQNKRQASSTEPRSGAPAASCGGGGGSAATAQPSGSQQQQQQQGQPPAALVPLFELEELLDSEGEEGEEEGIVAAPALVPPADAALDATELAAAAAAPAKARTSRRAAAAAAAADAAAADADADAAAAGNTVQQGAMPVAAPSAVLPLRQQQQASAASQFELEELGDSDEEGLEGAAAVVPAVVPPGQAAGATGEAGVTSATHAAVAAPRAPPAGGQEPRQQARQAQQDGSAEVQDSQQPSAAAPVRRSARAAAKRQREEQPEVGGEPQDGAALLGEDAGMQQQQGQQPSDGQPLTAACSPAATGAKRQRGAQLSLQQQDQEQQQVDEAAASAAAPLFDQACLSAALGKAHSAQCAAAPLAAAPGSQGHLHQQAMRQPHTEPALAAPLITGSQELPPEAADEAATAQQRHLQQEQHANGASPTPTPAAAAWSVAEDKLMLRTLLQAGGQLSAEQLAGLAEHVGGASSVRTTEAVAERCLALMQLYAERKRRAAGSRSPRSSSPRMLSITALRKWLAKEIELCSSGMAVVFSHGGKEYEVQPLESAKDMILVCELMARGCELTNVAFSDLVKELNACAAGGFDGNNWSPLHQAAAWGRPAICQVLLAAEPQKVEAADSGGMLPLHLAAKNGHTVTCQMLLDAAPQTIAAADSHDMLPVHLAAWAGHTATCQLLLGAAPETVTASDLYGRLPLHRAATNGQTATCQLLLDAAPQTIAAADSEGMLPVHWAARNGDTATLQLLLNAAPGMVTAADSDGMLPVHCASCAGHTATCHLLLDTAPGTVTAVDLYGRLPLHWAAGNGHTATCQLLLDAPETITAVDICGQLPLHLAARNGRTATCQLLLDRAPQTAVVADIDGRTPLQLALARTSPRFDIARCFVAAAPAAGVLVALAAVPKTRPLCADFFITRSLHLTSKEWSTAWSAVPAPCPGLMRALPAVLARSTEQAGHLVQHLPPADVQRLRTAVLCLARAQKQSGVFLPTPVAWSILALLGG
ncbi:Ankyrin repeat [Chlorella vulgaris]